METLCSCKVDTQCILKSKPNDNYFPKTYEEMRDIIKKHTTRNLIRDFQKSIPHFNCSYTFSKN